MHRKKQIIFYSTLMIISAIFICCFLYNKSKSVKKGDHLSPELGAPKRQQNLQEDIRKKQEQVDRAKKQREEDREKGDRLSPELGPSRRQQNLRENIYKKQEQIDRAKRQRDEDKEKGILHGGGRYGRRKQTRLDKQLVRLEEEKKRMEENLAELPPAKSVADTLRGEALQEHLKGDRYINGVEICRGDPHYDQKIIAAQQRREQKQIDHAQR